MWSLAKKVEMIGRKAMHHHRMQCGCAALFVDHFKNGRPVNKCKQQQPKQACSGGNEANIKWSTERLGAGEEWKAMIDHEADGRKGRPKMHVYDTCHGALQGEHYQKVINLPSHVRNALVGSSKQNRQL